MMWARINRPVMVIPKKGIMIPTSRVCTCCKKEKPFEEFGNSKKGKWGKREQCKDCKRNKDREYERANPEKMTAKHRRWVERHREHVREYDRIDYANNRERHCEVARESRKRLGITTNESKSKYPEKRKARAMIENEILRGRLKRPGFCEQCESSCTPEAHHFDYSKPLEVEWLCTSCHGKRHRIRAERLSERSPL